MKNICFQMTRKAWLAIAMVLCLSFPALAQKTTVTGTVVDYEGEPAIGASVIAEGTSNGVATDFDGNFSIDVAPNAVLVVSYVGCETQRVPVDGRTHIDITLKSNAVVLNEVVAIGYGTVKKSDATGSVAVVKPDEIEAGLATSAQDMLVGATPGVVVSTTGNPSEGGTIRIRGGSSLSASNDPLIIVDGVPMDGNSVKGSSNALSLIAPENIESMTVLKDASATAIYGSRASNGVIIVTTKKGQAGKPQVNFSANLYVATPRKTVDMMDGNQFRSFVLKTYGEGSTQAGALGTANTNWQDEVLRTAVSSDYNLSVGGTVGILPYRVSIGYTSNHGIIRKTGMNRATASINLSPKFFDGLLQVNANIKGAYVRNNYEQGVLGGAVSFNPTLPVRCAEGNVFNNWTSYIGGGALAGPNTPGTDLNTIESLNPVSRSQDYDSKSDVYQSVGNLQLDLRMPFLRDLRANLNLGYDYSHGSVASYNYPFSPEAWKAGHRSPGVEAAVKDGYSTINYEKQRIYNLLLEFYLNYNKDFEAIKSSLDVTAGYSWQKFYNKGCNWSPVYAPGQEFDGYLYNPRVDYSKPYQLVSFFGRLQYGFMDKYLLTVTVRRDGSSRFSSDNRWGTFPSVALAWRLIDESFMEGTRSVLSDLKIRGTWGITGQQNLGDDFSRLFPYLPIYNGWTGSDNMGFNPVTGEYLPIYAPSSYNVNLKWEETTTWNVGVDFGFLNNRISGSVDAYYRKTKDLLTSTTYAAGSNLGPDGPMNIGDLTNKGIEVNLLTRPIVTKDFTWSSNINVAYNKNEITHLASGKDIPTGDIGNSLNVQLQREGYAANSFFVYEQVYNPDGTPAEGVYVDRNGDGQITDQDKYMFHSPDPKWTANWQNTFNVKNWDFGISLRANFGNWVFNKTQQDNSFVSTTAALPLGNLMNDTYLFTSTKSTPLLASDYWVQNASFVRCDNITAGYTFENLLNNALRLRLFAAVQNPFVITKYKGIDPEVFGGIDSGIYPKPITFTLGLVATF